MDIGLRHPDVFGAVESWSGYFTPLRDGPFKHASKQVLADNDPVRLARHKAALLRADGTRFFVSTGPFHSHWFRPEQTIEFARELHSLGLPVSYHRYANAKGEWRAQLDTGLEWAFGRRLATCPERTRPGAWHRFLRSELRPLAVVANGHGRCQARDVSGTDARLLRQTIGARRRLWTRLRQVGVRLGSIRIVARWRPEPSSERSRLSLATK